MKKHTRHTMPSLRQMRFDAPPAGAARRVHQARPVGEMTPIELRAEVLALIG